MGFVGNSHVPPWFAAVSLILLAHSLAESFRLWVPRQFAMVAAATKMIILSIKALSRDGATSFRPMQDWNGEGRPKQLTSLGSRRLGFEQS